MSNLLQKNFRGYLIDHHSPAPPTVTLEALNPKEYEAFFKEAQISGLMLYTKDHWGYSYYDTQIGTRHPALKSDFVGEISTVLKKNHMEFNAYYCLEYDTLAPKLHPEWAIRDQNGEAVALKGRMAKWGMPCYETGYRNYVLGQLEEVVNKYHPDSLFLDIFGKTLCYCPACKKKFYGQYGYELPTDPTAMESELGAFDFGEQGRDVNAFLEDCAAQMLRDIIARVKAIDPELKVTINFAALYPKKIRDLLDYQFTEPWAGNWLSAAYSRDTAGGKYPQLGPGDVSEVYNYRPDSIYELAAAQIAAQGCRVFMYSGSQHVDGTLEHTEAQKVGRAYGEIVKFEQYLGDRTVIADVAILQSDSSSEARTGTEVVMNAIGRCKKTNLHRQAVLGAMKLCDGAKYSWCVVPEQEFTADRAKNFQCVILAGLFHVNPELKAVLTDFVKSGGKLIADGECGLYDIEKPLEFPLTEILGCSYQKKSTAYQSADWGGYVAPVAPIESEIWKYAPKTFPPVGPTQCLVHETTGHCLGRLIYPCTALTETSWVNWWCPPPEMKATEFPAIVQNTIGAGESVYFAYDFFSGANQGFHLNRNIFAGVLAHLLPEPRLFLKTDFPDSVGFVAYEKQGKIILHNLSHLAEKTNGDCPPVAGGILRLHQNLGAVQKAAVVYPTPEMLPVSTCGRYREITLPRLSIHTVIEIELA